MTEERRFQVEKKDGRAFIDGQDIGLTIEQFKSMRVRARGMRAQRFLTRYDKVHVDDPRIRGFATIEGTLKVAVLGASSRKLGLSIGLAPEADADRLDWHASWGYIAPDWETNTGTSWYLEIRLPRAVWEDFKRDYEAGRVAEVAVAVKGDFWTEWSPLPALDDTVFHMLPDTYGSTAGGHGSVDSFGWADDKILRLDDDEMEPETADPDVPARSPSSSAAPAESPLGAIMKAGTAANEKLAKTLAWGIPAIVVLLAIIAMRM